MATEAWDHQDRLNRMNPAAQRAALGDVVQELIDQHNALCTKLDADVGVTDTDYVSTLGIQNLNDR